MDLDDAVLRGPRVLAVRRGPPIAVPLAMRQHRFEEDEESTVFMQREAPSLDVLVDRLAPKRRVDERGLGASDDSMSLDEIAQSTFGPWDDHAFCHDEHDEHDEELATDSSCETDDESELGDTSDEPSLFNRPFFEQAFSKRVFGEGDYEEAAPLPEHEGTMIYVAPPPPSRIVSTMAMSAPPPPNRAPFANTLPLHFAPLRPVHAAADPALAPTVSVQPPAPRPALERFLASPLVAVGFAIFFAAAVVLIAFVKIGMPSSAPQVQTRNVAVVPVVVPATTPIATVPVVAPAAPPIAPAATAATPPITTAVADATPAVETKPAAPKPVAAAQAPQARPVAPGFQVSFAVRAPTAKEKPKPQTKRGGRDPSVEEILATLREEQLKR